MAALERDEAVEALKVSEKALAASQEKSSKRGAALVRFAQALETEKAKFKKADAERIAW